MNHDSIFILIALLIALPAAVGISVLLLITLYQIVRENWRRWLHRS